MSARAVAICEETPGDAGAIGRVLRTAFPTDAEAQLVDALRAEGDVVLSLLAWQGETLAGVVVFSRLQLEGATNARAVALGPLAVQDEFRRRGIGAMLVRHGHGLLASRGLSLSLVLGDPAYYERFGYAAAAAASFRTPYDGPHQMALRLSEDAPRCGTLRYARAFSDLA